MTALPALLMTGDDAPTLLLARELDTSDIRTLVDRALRGDVPLDTLVTTALFGPNHDPHRTTWGEWPPQAVQAWDRAVACYVERRDARAARSARSSAVQIPETWAAIEAVGTVDEWWRIPFVTYNDIAPIIGVKPKQVAYWFVLRYGWRFAGHSRSRRVVEAPCVQCGTVTKAALIEGRRCRACANG